MQGDVVERIADLVKQTSLVQEINGETYSTNPLHHIVHDPRPEPLFFTSLTGLRDFVVHNIDGVDAKDMIAVIDSPKAINLYGKIEGPTRRRTILGKVQVASDLEEFPFGKYLSHEELIIKLYTLFEGGEDIQQLKDIVATLRAEKVIESKTEGIGQHVVVAEGVSGAKNVKVPPIVSLAPFRTFREIKQPESLFLCRAKSQDSMPPTIALHEADGGAWRMVAVEGISAWIKANVPDLVVMA